MKGGKFHMPSIDISLPGGGAGGDVDVEGPAEKEENLKCLNLRFPCPN